MKKFSISDFLRDILADLSGVTHDEQAAWLHDPLSHPDIKAMSERQRADLPFARIASDAGKCGSLLSRRPGAKIDQVRRITTPIGPTAPRKSRAITKM